LVGEAAYSEPRREIGLGGADMAGPLTGFRILELVGIGPGPFAAMMLSDMGADVIRIDRAASVGGGGLGPRDVTARGRRSIGLDLKNPEGVEALLRLVDGADALMEGYRPGVTERMGLGPDVCLARNPRLVYGRMTGWGQEGPYSGAAGHDINYIALSGVLAHLGRAGEKPTPPINLVGDFGGGGMYLAFGIVAALLERERSGVGQVVDAAMVDGAASLASFIWGLRAGGMWGDRGTNMIDTGSDFYDTYECSDGKFVAIGPVEGQFYAVLLANLGLTDDPDFLGGNMSKEQWGKRKERLREIFLTKSRDEWVAVFGYGDACFAPVLTIEEAPHHPHAIARKAFVEIGGVLQPAPAPRFSRTVAEVKRPPAIAGDSTREVLREAGFDDKEVEALIANGAVR
jgi:alpha-methylacyl-CoA racemase